MGLLTWADSKIAKMRLYDISMVKLSVAAAILLIAKLWDPILGLDWYWYLVIFVIAAILQTKKMFSKSEVWVKGNTK